MNASQRDELLARLVKLDCDEAFDGGPASIPLSRETLRLIIAALQRCKAIEEGS